MRLAVVTEVPDARGEDLLVELLDEQDLFYRSQWLHVFPEAPRQDSGRTRSPTKAEVNARSNLVTQNPDLQLATHVVLAGNVPLWCFRPDLRIGNMRGRALVAKGRVLFPVINPIAALRNPVWARDIGSDLYHLRQIIEADDWTLNAPNTCVWCLTPTTEPQWDSNGVLYCPKHWRTR